MMEENQVLPEPAELLLKAHHSGVTVQSNGKGGLRLSPLRLVKPELFYGARRIKPALLALVSKLEECGAADDPLILVAVALFKVEPESITRGARSTFAAPVRVRQRAGRPKPTPGKANARTTPIPMVT